MEQKIKKYVKRNNILNIVLYKNSTCACFETLYLYYLNCSDNTLQILIKARKYLSVEFRYQLDSYENLDILLHANKIIVLKKNIKNENIIKIINKPLNLPMLET